MLIDRFGRVHNYLRISITDQCNFRCSYCMPDVKCAVKQSGRILNADEIIKIGMAFSELGISKIRITGGEPLIRKDFAQIAEGLSETGAELLLSTNGTLVDTYLSTLLSCGISTVNVSLDTLNPDLFLKITKRNSFHRVWDNIMLLLENGIRVKLNVVAIKGMIESELIPFITLTKHLPLHIRFIEFMPFSGNRWEQSRVVSSDTLLNTIRSAFPVFKLNDEPHSTAKKYQVNGYAGTFAFITSMSNQFCASCNRIRLTSEGKIKNCLFGKEEFDLIGSLRQGLPIKACLDEALNKKHKALGGRTENTSYHTFLPKAFDGNSMVAIGG